MFKNPNEMTCPRHDSELGITQGMAFHLSSWFTETGRGDYVVSNTALPGPDGSELLTQVPTVIR